MKFKYCLSNCDFGQPKANKDPLIFRLSINVDKWNFVLFLPTRRACDLHIRLFHVKFYGNFIFLNLKFSILNVLMLGYLKLNYKDS